MTSKRTSPEERLVMYQVVAARRLGFDQLLWQVPGVAMTAQAFLMTIGLAPGAGRLARVAVGCIAMVISWMSIQLLMRHRRNEIADAHWLQKFEREAGWEILHDTTNRRAARMGVETPLLARGRSHRIWVLGLSSFGFVGLGIVINALVG